jgi:adenine-specific DNA-methyltransferase
MDLLRFSETNNFLPALKGFFEDLKVPVNYVSDLPATAKEILINSYKENETFKAINDVYFLGIVDDAAFDKQKSIDAKQIKSDYDGILIFGVELHQRNKDLLPTRSQLAEIARAFNREFYYTPVVVVFKYGNHIAFANTERIQYKQEWREGEKVGKVTLLRDIDLNNVHEGHRRILENLEISRNGKSAINDFNSLYKYWQEVLSVSILNKVFYKELSNWYFWAIKEVRFPNEPLQLDFDSLDKYDEAIKEHNGKNVIRLLTRLLFIWFIKEKGLIPEEIFDEKEITNRFIDGFTPQKPEGMFVSGKNSSKYYRAILQNLFFATLNQPRGEREFRCEGKHLNATQLMRYQSYLKDPEYFIQLMESKVPFMNGGLFECLDKPHPTLKGAQGGDRIIYVDGFSDRPDNELLVPDFLFFDADEIVDLSKDYGNTKSKNEKTRGLFNILKSYKFTITENTPIDEDVALDPELLGKVFENLLASYNPETKTTARKQTGSFYTPREIVNYMVEESLIAYLKNELSLIVELNEQELNNALHELVSFSTVNPFKDNSSLQRTVIKALDTCKILDPACGSGAYPMGILQKMVHVLHKIDPNNNEWKQRQIDRVNEAIDLLELVDDVEYKNKAIKELKAQIKDIEAAFENNELDYGRKLFLIENCIYGVDIQPIATQISKLRFFISLVVDQKVDASKDNFGIRPLPNLETKFVAANTLIGLPNGIQGSLFDKREVKKLEDELKKVRHKLFSVKTPSIKRELRAKDKALREEMQTALAEQLGNETAQLLAQWDPYDQNTSSPFFDKEWMFDVREGFDVVIGNPPYVQLQKLNGSEIYSKLDFFTYSKSSDLYCLFYEKGIQLLNNNGNLNYITSNSWMRTKYGKDLRAYFREKTNPLILINFEDVQIFESAVVESNIIIIEKKINQNLLKAVNLGFDYNKSMNLNQYLFKKGVNLDRLDDNGWILGEESILKLKLKVEKNTKTVKQLNYYIVRGFTTGCNEAFYINEIDKDRITHNNENALEIIRPILRGRDLSKWSYAFNNVYSLVMTRNINITNYKTVETHLLNFKEKLSQKSGTAKWYELQANPSTEILNSFVKPKIIWGELSDKAKFTFDEKGYYLDATVFLMTGDNLKYILSIFNSKLAQWYFEQIATSSGMGTNRWKKYKIEQFPIKVISDEKINQFEILVNQILEGKKSDQDTSALEHQIDIMVYHLYDLTYEEACVIDNGLSKEDFELYKIN